MKDLDKIIFDNQLNKINDNIFLTNYQIDTLNKFAVPYQKCQNMSELIYMLEDYDDEELEEVKILLSDFYYYNYTKK